MQKAFSFDQETVGKIFRGAIIAATGAGAIAFLDYIGKVQIDDPLLASFVVWIVPVATNAIKEYIKGR
jgi:hypothetical protein